MEAATFAVAVVLGGGGLVGAIYNWWIFRHQKVRETTLDFWESFERQATSADKRGDRGEADRIRHDYERQLEAFRAQQAVKRISPPDRINPNE